MWSKMLLSGLTRAEVIDQTRDPIVPLQKRKTTKPIGFYQTKYKDEKQAVYQAYLSGSYTLKKIGEH
ncbi:MAG: hypothetical protein ACI8XX_001730 [Polaribacter sp.]|jgi:hypothetical protein